MRAFKRLALLGLTVWLLAVLARAGIAGSFELRMLLGDARRVMATLENTQGPCRVFVVGSSPTLFGVSASTLAAETGCAAVNLSMVDVGARLDDYLARVLRHVRPGDVLVFTDRRWTQFIVPDGECGSTTGWSCFASAIHFAPYVVERLRLFVPQALPRDALGDLASFPPMTSRRFVFDAVPLEDLQARAAHAGQQAGAIRTRGACAILAPAPMLVSHEARAQLDQAYARLGQQVDAAAQAAVWLPPMLETEPGLFVLEGQHPSARQRTRWTSQIVQAIRRQCPAATTAQGG